MTTIFDVYLFINFVTNKDNNGYLTPPEVSKALDVAQNALWENYLGKRQDGNELALVALQPFYKKTTVISDGNGLALYPSLWAETQAIYKPVAGIDVSLRQVLHDELYEAQSSVMYPIAANPRYLEQETGAQLYPKVNTTVDWHYLSRPTTPYIGFTVSGNEVEPSPIDNVELQFAPQYWNETIALALKYIGVNLADQQIEGLVQTFSLNANNGNNGN